MYLRSFSLQYKCLHWFSCRSVGKFTYIQRAKTKPVYHSSPLNNATILTMLWCPEIGLELDEGGAILSVGWPCVCNFLSLGISHMKWLQNWLEKILLLFCVNVHVVKHFVLCLVSLYYNTINSCFKIDYYPWMEIRVDLFMVEGRSTVPYVQLWRQSCQ